tara:strand:- start:4258 stop:5436 length:1179 start_codon:yes stop_codon:yes gene_type:complete
VHACAPAADVFRVIVVLTIGSATNGKPANHERTAMARAIDLARHRQGRTHPNPPVGALVITRDGRCVGTGSTQAAGNAHAEAVALTEAGAHARGATLVVTLEPCNHAGRTPPCTETIVRAGINRIVIGCRDMNSAVRGGGIEYLRQHGVEVVLETIQAAVDLAQGHHKLCQTGRPFVTAKWAMTLDGRVNVPAGGGRISGSAAHQHVHKIRNSVDAVITGAESIRVDDSRLTVRPPPEDGRQPIGVVFDSLARTNPGARVFQSEAHTLILTTQAAPLSRVRTLEEAGATVIECSSEKTNRICIDSALAVLGNRGLTTVLLEAGPTLTRAFLDAEAVDQCAVFVAAWTMGSGQLAPISVSELHKEGSPDQAMHLVGPDLLFLSDERRYGPGAA